MPNFSFLDSLEVAQIYLSGPGSGREPCQLAIKLSQLQLGLAWAELGNYNSGTMKKLAVLKKTIFPKLQIIICLGGGWVHPHPQSHLGYQLNYNNPLDQIKSCLRVLSFANKWL